MRLFVLVVLAGIMVLSLSTLGSAEDSAWDQLQQAGEGAWSTGETFDGGVTPTDAYSSGAASVPEIEPVEVSSSTSTTGGYSVDSSSDTASGDTSTGYETESSSETTSGYSTDSYEVSSSSGTTGGYSYGEETAD